MILADAPRAPHPVDGALGMRVAARFETARPLIAGAAGSSGYLAGLIEREADWLASVLDTPPDRVMQALLADISADDPALGESLRRTKRRAALLIALADLGGLWTLDEVTGALSDLADASVRAALAKSLSDVPDRAGLLGEAGGLFVLAMGKHGARELNYSSDIDLILFFDDTRYGDDEAVFAARKALVRATQAMVKLLSAVTDAGYVFRTDLRLRPDPAVTPVCMGVTAAERYYESLGRTWERAAMIKARVIAGDHVSGRAFLDGLRPFIWRRNLDFAAIRDAEAMVEKIRHHKGLSGPITFDRHDLKLGRGGIREIEFYAQTHQLIFGGRDDSLRGSRTVDALTALAKAGRIDEKTATTLIDAYTAHRSLEHRIQMLDDAQTHTIPDAAEKRARLAALSGFADDLPAFEADIVARLSSVHGLTKLRPSDAAPPEAPVADLTLNAEIDRAHEAWRRRPVLRDPRSQEMYAALRPRIAQALEMSGDWPRALAQFDGFLQAQPAGVQLFALFDANPQLIDLIVKICAVAPAAASYLAANPSALEAVLSADFYAPLQGGRALDDHLSAALSGAGDYEDALDAMRRWHKEQHFRISVQMLTGAATPEAAGEAFSRVADAVIRAALAAVEQHLAPRFGPAPGRGMAVLAMGKLGSREMTATSDLDLIIVYDAGGIAETAGPKSIASPTYFARATQALIAALTAPTAEGRLYEVDMRLRPSGRKGPVATSLSAFSSYQAEDAWTWEHLALTRGRVLAGAPGLVADVKAAIAVALAKPRDGRAVMADMREMRARLAATGQPGRWEIKKGPGRLLDIELLAQAGVLMTNLPCPLTAQAALPGLVEADWLGQEDAAVLGQAHRFMTRLQHLARLVGDDLEGELRGATAAMLEEGLDCPALAISTRLEETAAQAGAVIEARFAADRDW